jgi:phospholipase/carboxylesterase
MIFNTVVMLGTRSILMQTKINFQITNRQNLLDLIAGFIDELIQLFYWPKGFLWLQPRCYIELCNFYHIQKRSKNCFGYINEEIWRKLKNNDFKTKYICFPWCRWSGNSCNWARKTTPFWMQEIESVYKEYPIGHGISPQIFLLISKWLILKKKGSKIWNLFFLIQ